jgi:hypothetical protein
MCRGENTTASIAKQTNQRLEKKKKKKNEGKKIKEKYFSFKNLTHFLSGSTLSLLFRQDRRTSGVEA